METTETSSVPEQDSGAKGSGLQTSNGKHLEPAPLLDDADKDNDADDGKRDERQLLGELVHRDL